MCFSSFLEERNDLLHRLQELPFLISASVGPGSILSLLSAEKTEAKNVSGFGSMFLKATKFVDSGIAAANSFDTKLIFNCFFLKYFIVGSGRANFTIQDWDGIH